MPKLVIGKVKIESEELDDKSGIVTLSQNSIDSSPKLTRTTKLEDDDSYIVDGIRTTMLPKRKQREIKTEDSSINSNLSSEKRMKMSTGKSNELFFENCSLTAAQQETARNVLSILQAFAKSGIKSLHSLFLAGKCGFKSVDTKNYRVVPTFLKKRGLIQACTGSLVVITPKGMQIAAGISTKNDHDLPKTNEEFIDQLCQLLGSPHCTRLIRALRDGKQLTKQGLAKACKLAVDTKNFRESLKELKTKGVLWINGMEVVGKSPVSADALISLADFCFPMGRP